MFSFRKVYSPDTLKYRWMIHFGWYSFPLSGYWFGKGWLNNQFER